MESAAPPYLAVLATTALAALGGAFAVYAGYDDAPGGVLIGLALIVGGLVLGLRSARRRT